MRREEIDAAMSGTLEANCKRNGSERYEYTSWAIWRLVEELESNAPEGTFGPLCRNTLVTRTGRRYRSAHGARDSTHMQGNRAYGLFSCVCAYSVFYLRVVVYDCRSLGGSVN